MARTGSIYTLAHIRMDHPLLIAGCGYVGSRLATEQVALGRTVYGLRRNVSALPPGVVRVAADLAAPGALDGVPSLGQLVYCPSAGGRSEGNYRLSYLDGVDALADALGDRASSITRAVYVSSTAVYGDDFGGADVDESTPPRAQTVTSRILLEGEARFRERFSSAVVLRLSGIYGPGRVRLVRQVLEGGPFDTPAEAYGNRIHRDDCAGAIAHLLAREAKPADAVYLGVDQAPVPLGEVRAFVARLAQLDETPFRPRGAPTGKRLRGDKLRATGYAFRVPTYREGYPAIVAEALATQPPAGRDS